MLGMIVKYLTVAFFGALFSLSSWGQTANLQTFKGKEGKKFDQIGLPGGPFKVLDHVPSARSSSGLVVFEKASVGKTSDCTISVKVSEGVEISRAVAVEGRKKAEKFYQKTAKEEFGTPFKLVEVNGIYVYSWTPVSLTEQASATIEYHWNSREKKGTLITQLHLSE